jgi:hypothetical protein
LPNKTIKDLKLEWCGKPLVVKGVKSITDAITWKNEDAERVIMKFRLPVISTTMCHYVALKKLPLRFLNWKKKPKAS